MPDEEAPIAARRSRHGRRIGAGLLGVGLVAAAWLLLARGDRTRPIQPGQVVAPGAAAGFNVLLVTLDTTRQDRLGCYGYAPAETPAIDSLAACGIRFDDAVTSSPVTLPSHATMLTGLYPVTHGTRDNGTYRLTEDHRTLAEVLQARGYQTAAFVSSFVLDRRFGLAQGFDLYDFEVTAEGFRPDAMDLNERPADAVTDAAVRWLDRRQQAAITEPFFAWVHYFDPHYPYRSPLSKTPRFAERPYDGEIAFVDAQLKRLLDALLAHGLRERTVIALVTDHGEALGQHREETHGFFLYDSTVRVGFILSCPALFDRAYRVSDRVVGLVDLKPTIEDLLGITPNVPRDGQSLLADISPDRAIYAETLIPLTTAGWSPLYAMRRHTDKYVLAPQSEYYDLAADAQESRNLYAQSPAAMDALQRQLAELRKRDRDGRPGGATRVMSVEETERLRALGYIHSVPSPSSGPRPDPKEMISAYLKIQRAMVLIDQDRPDEALRLVQAALLECDSYPVGERTLASIYFRLGRLDEAVNVLRDSARRRPEILTYVSLARVLLHMRRFGEVERTILDAEKVSPDDGRVPMLRGDLLGLQGHFAEAIAEYENAIRIDEHRVGIRARQKIEQVRSLMEQGERP
ncbi:MAG TPA: sulfatase-like hydrolase/transferase [Phycisphaerae bacterium]|nr:sulfatase-like hydrolase/transferase [Phycisphaerae bacterium]